MGQVIEFRPAQVARPAPLAEAKCRCGICGADLWHIKESGEVCCADCDTVCPYRLHDSTASDKRQGECGLAGSVKTDGND